MFNEMYPNMQKQATKNRFIRVLDIIKIGIEEEIDEEEEEEN